MSFNKCNNGENHFERVKVIGGREWARKESKKKKIIKYRDYKIIL